MDGGAHAHGAARFANGGAVMASGPPVTTSFIFDGQIVQGRVGEPIAVALLAAGVRVFRTMPESGEPRGGYCLVGRCSDCQVIVDGVPGVMACVTPVEADLIVQSQHGLGEEQLELDWEAMP